MCHLSTQHGWYEVTSTRDRCYSWLTALSRINRKAHCSRLPQCPRAPSESDVPYTYVGPRKRQMLGMYPTMDDPGRRRFHFSSSEKRINMACFLHEHVYPNLYRSRTTRCARCTSFFRRYASPTIDPGRLNITSHDRSPTTIMSTTDLSRRLSALSAGCSPDILDVHRDAGCQRVLFEGRAVGI